MSTRTYNISQEFLAACQVLDVNPESIVGRLGLPTTSLQTDGLHLSPRQIATVFELIIMAYGRDDFHIRLAQGFANGAFGHAFLALQCSENLRKGIQRVAHFKLLIEPVEWRITDSRETFSIELRSLTSDFPLMGIGQIMSFLWLVKSCRNVTAKSIVPIRVQITDTVPHQHEIETDLGCPITIGNKALIEFASALMDSPVLSANSKALAGLVHGSTSMPLAAPGNDSCVVSVQSIVLELLPSGAVTIERVAHRLATSRRTLERRLRERNSSFKTIVQECRRDLARHYINDTQMPISEISLMLGYRETNSFFRAFKEWFGRTPQQARDNTKDPRV